MLDEGNLWTGCVIVLYYKALQARYCVTKNLTSGSLAESFVSHAN